MATFDVTDVLRRAQATGNGSTTSFAFSFRINNTSDVKVYVDSTLKTESSHYSVQDGSGGAGLAANGTGAVVFGSAPANNAIVTILSDVPLSRAGVYTSGGTITAAALETDFDSLTMALGDREERDARSLMAPVNDTTSVDMTLPAKATRAGKVLGFNASTGNPEAGPSITDVQTLSAVTASIALLGTSDAVSDMNALATSAIIEDMNLLATSTVIEDMGLLATSTVIEDMGLLATSAVIEDMGLLGTSANVTAMGLLGTSAVIEDMGILSASAVVADMALLATTDVIADMALLGNSDVISDMNTLATSDIVSDLNVLATSDIVSDMNALATSDIISDLNALATSDIISDMNALATSDIISDMNTLATSAVIADMASLAGSGANPNITSVTASGTIQFGSLSDGTITITDIADEDNMSSNSAVKLATQQSIKAYVDGQSSLSLIDEDNMASNSATRPPSQQSVKAYVDAVVPLVIIDEDNMATDSATRPPSQQSVKAYVDATTTIANAALPKSGGAMTGVLTADAGIDIDNFNIDGTTIALSSGDMVIDGAEDIILDAAGNQIRFKDNGTEVGFITMSGSDLGIKSTVNDKDIIFKGVDNSSEIVAATFDMSEKGAFLIGDLNEQTHGGRISQTVVSGDSGISIMSRSATDSHQPEITLMKTPATSGNYTATADGEALGSIKFRGVNTSAVSDIGAQIRAVQNGTASGTVPTNLVFSTNETDRLTIASNGTASFSASAVAKTDTDTSNSGSVTLDFAANQNFVLTLTGNVTLANPSTEQVGQSGFITLIQDGTGGRTLSLGTDYETASGAGITLTSTASATDIVPYVVAASGRILLGAPQLAFS